MRRRDRRGRGIRGPLVPSDLPVFRSRAQAFDDLVLDAVERLERLWARELANVDFLVEDVPPIPRHGPLSEAIPFSRLETDPSGRSRIVVYRRPVEIRTKDPEEMALLVHETVVEEVANLLGVEPESVDPES
ncbi:MULTISPECIES: metallopeptidase family protein [Nocardiopsidaceae]|uniref:Metallopeptidase family protein n=2 Tax=Nocardiopsidaceae TaxID=83676 RepID=A0ABY6YQB6_9ACTN|nr:MULTISPECIES: metallopeptidase family protein [Nocardiopsaceae]MEE2045607.1 metallopeptidase family protein [Nocardiopsis tropica]MEE2051834.1 metallopeptidase family protein [Nocardiopsis umidischolae]WAE74522.1 metallopeptidase family protein [Streptomonospora nanhaiensis]